MKCKKWIESGLVAVLLVLGSWAYVHAEFLAIQGSPLEIRANERGTIGVYRWENGELHQQYFGGDLGIGSALLFSVNGPQLTFRARGPAGFDEDDHPELTPISHLKSADGWRIVTVLGAGDTGIQVKLTISYANGGAYYRKVWEIANTGTTTCNNLKLLHGGDTYFGNDDSSEGHWDANLGMIYLTNPNPGITGIMGFYGGVNSPAHHYYEDHYAAVWQAISNGVLPDTVLSTYHDAGYALQWNRSTLAPGDTWTIESFEKWTEAGYVQVVAPSDQVGNPGDTLTYRFVVQNYQQVEDTVDLTLASSGGWEVNLPERRTLIVPAGGSATVNAEVTIPEQAVAGATDQLTLTAASQTDSTISNSDTVTTTVASPLVVGPRAIIADVDGDGACGVEDYHMVSLPGLLTPRSQDPLMVFAGQGAVYDASSIRIFNYRTQTQSYTEYADVPPVSPGVGYWLLTQVDLEAGATGEPVSSGQPFAVTLAPGWSMVGQPFLGQSAWRDVKVRVDTGGGPMEYLIGDPANVWVEHQAWGYDSGYSAVDPTTGILEPWNSYWVRNMGSEAVTILIPPPTGELARSRPADSSTYQKAGTAAPGIRRGISFSLKERRKSYTDRTLFLGFDRNASDGADSLDCLAPPPVSALAPMIYVDHGNWSVRPGAYAVDFRPLGNQPTTFALKMDVRRRPYATRYLLKWRGTGTIPARFRPVLVDKAKGKRIDMRTNRSYSIVVPANRTSYGLKVVFR